MKKIEMVDLHRQYLRHKEEINSAIQEVIHSTAFIKGPDVREFQREMADYIGARFCIACGNGTDALQAALMALGLQPGDEVITSPFTFVATIEVISLLKLKPVLADVDPGTFNIDPSQIERAITAQTKAIVPVHLFGQAANMNRIIEIANANNLSLIEDNAQALGASYRLKNGSLKKTGNLGDIGCTSFFPSKSLGAYGDGGALFTNDQELASKIGSILNHGMTQRYYYDHIGVNSRLDTIQAAILRVKLKSLDAYNRARQEVAKAYDEAFSVISGLKIPERNPESEHIFHQYTLQVPGDRRNTLKEHLKRHDVPAMIYYPVPLHLQKAYAGLGYTEGDFPVAEELCRNVLSLPIHTEMDEEQLNHIISTLKQFFNQ